MRNLFRALIRPSNDRLFSRVMSAGFWSAALRIALRMSVLVRTVILARLLVPDDFGLMAIATISILFVERLAEGGIDAAIIQRRGDVRLYLDAAWTLQIARSLATAAIIFLSAPYIAVFFDAPEVQPIIRVLIVSLILKGFTNVAVVLFQKDLRFDRHFALEMSGQGVDVVVSIAFAFALQSVWALVFGAIAGSASRLVASYVLDSYRPRIKWNWIQIRSLFTFGKWILAGHFLHFVSSNVSDIVVGRLLGVTSLGLYRMASNFGGVMTTEITGVAHQVAFPTYSKLQGSADRLRQAYMGSLHLISFIGFPAGIGIVVVAPDLVHGLLGAQWVPIIVPLQILAVGGIFLGLGGTVGPLLQSQGRPDVPPRFDVARLAMLIVLLYPAIGAWGLNGAAIAVAGAAVISSTAALLVALRWVSATEREVRQALVFPAFNTGLMTVAVVGIQVLFPDLNAVLSLLISAMVGVVVYLTSVALSSKLLHYHAPNDLIERVRKATIG
jgi:O-antigen/teichoic acid export membrane protein